MKSIREFDLERAFTTMMNKLIFAKKDVLDALLDGIRGETHKENLRRINEIDQKLEQTSPANPDTKANKMQNAEC